MRDIGLSLRLRPIRFAFLIKPHDAKNLQKIFEINTSLWGGLFNPIIPYFERVPKWWDRHPVWVGNARRIIDGYLKFFEPDFIVEAEKGLSAKLEIPSDIVLQIKDLQHESRRRSRESYGLNVFELYKDLYHKEFKFVRRHEHRIIHVDLPHIIVPQSG